MHAVFDAFSCSDLTHTAANDVTKQKDLSMFHRHLLNRLDHGSVEEEEGKSEITTRSEKRRVSEEAEGSSQRERERERDRSESDEHNKKQRERRISGEERLRHRSGGSVSAGEEKEEQEIPWTIEKEGVSENMEEERESKEKLENEREEEGEEEKEEGVGEVDRQKGEEEAPKLPSELTQEDKEERRKVAATKRTDSEAQLSAKERYLARKRARTTAPVVVKDD